MMEFIMSFPIWFWMIVIAFVLIGSFYLLTRAKTIKAGVVQIEMDEDEKVIEKSSEQKILESAEQKE